MGYIELTEQFERREKMRGTALTILGVSFGGLQEFLENIHLNTEG
ncbi:MAG: hypothetical protein V8S14_03995 [Lachnospiraceae bacterium]